MSCIDMYICTCRQWKEREREREIKRTPHLCVSRGDPLVWSIVLIVRVGGVCADDIDISGDDEREHLLASPEWLWLEDGRLRHLTIPTGKPHQKIHHIFLKRWKNSRKNISIIECNSLRWPGQKWHTRTHMHVTGSEKRNHFALTTFILQVYESD